MYLCSMQHFSLLNLTRFVFQRNCPRTSCMLLFCFVLFCFCVSRFVGLLFTLSSLYIFLSSCTPPPPLTIGRFSCLLPLFLLPALKMMLGISRHDITANNHGKGVEGMLILTELRLVFLPDIGVGSTTRTASFLDFNTVQVTDRLHRPTYRHTNLAVTVTFRCMFVACLFCDPGGQPAAVEGRLSSLCV